MENCIGEKTTFWALVKHNITIPTLQRDYIYGAQTEKTDEVLNNMLRTFKSAVETGKEEILDFVYGSESKAKEFMPLDGQQRLTTLFLLHFYAALIAKDDQGNSVVHEKDFEDLGRFSYATRNCTIAFCKNMLIGKHKELSEILANPDVKTNIFDSYLKDLDDFRGSYYTDPSVMSMIVVLDRIHSMFVGMTSLWTKLTADDCPINFYLLDFGEFDLSDDLYNKMNSRGKPLTAFEIFKAKMHKCILKSQKDKAETIAIKLDTDWMQYVWDTLNRTTELKKVDPAYMNIIKNIYRAFDYISGEYKQRFDKLDDNCLVHNMSNIWKIKAFENVFDTFATKASAIPAILKAEYNEKIQDCIKDDLKNSALLYLYAFYVGLLKGLEDTEFCYRFRHVRNLINNSTDQIREVSMTGLMADIKHVMQGMITKAKALQINKSSWAEEQHKEQYREVWSTLFEYEDISEINGSLQAFSINLNPESTLNLGDCDFVKAIKIRLNKAKHFFLSALKDEHERRSALLSIGNYSMSKKNDPQYRYFGVINSSWQNFTGFHRYDDRNLIMGIIDQIDISKPIGDYVGNTSNTNTENWRYYAIKYAQDITVANRKPDYGYIYFPTISSNNPSDDGNGYLDACILQSSYFGKGNIAWKMINRLVDQKYISQYFMYLDPHGGDRIRISKVSSLAAIDIQQDGWHIYGIEPEILSEVGIDYTVIENNSSIEEDANNCVVTHIIGKDYVVEGAEILEKLSKYFPELKKPVQQSSEVSL